ncbi:MAG: XdhC family protein [Acidimicrobiaceae bacterium]|nr:XdhC family protein [Acidimicrobiaceae bacterium]
MIRQDLSERAAGLRAGRVPFVHARVVLSERPTSAKPGDEAIVLGDGSMEGFVGGECADETVRRESVDALSRGETVLLRITPLPEPDQPGKHVVHNPCVSGGTLEIFLEPVLPPPLVYVVGPSPTARALLALGEPLGYSMAPWTGEVETDTAAVVVASHGHEEAEPLVTALEAGVPYVGLMASRRRGASVVSTLPVAPEMQARVHTPAGLDIGATTAEEVALSILAEIVAGQPRRPGAGYPAQSSVRTAVDPVCGMTVTVREDTPHQGDVYFCGPACMAAYQRS